MKRFAILMTAAVIAVGTLFCAAAFANTAVAQAVSVTPGAWATSGGKKIELKAGSDIFVSDVLTTDAKGRGEIKFADGTVIVMNKSSEVRVSEFVMTDQKNSFAAGVAKGVARVVTGNIVKRNPNGFKIETPRSTVGIRGTTVTLSVTPKMEAVVVDEIGAGSYLSVINRGSGAINRISSAANLALTLGNAPTVIAQKTPGIQRVIESIAEQAAQGQDLKDMDDMLKELEKQDPQLSEQLNEQINQEASDPMQPPMPPASRGGGTPNEDNILDIGQDKKSDGDTDKDKSVNTSPKPQTRCD